MKKSRKKAAKTVVRWMGCSPRELASQRFLMVIGSLSAATKLWRNKVEQEGWKLYRVTFREVPARKKRGRK